MNEKPSIPGSSEPDAGEEDPKEIAREMLKAGEPVDEIVRVTGLKKTQIYGLKGVIRKEEKKAEKPPEREREVGEEFAEKPELKDYEPEELVAFYGEEGLEMLLEQRLRRLLQAPGVGQKSRKWIMTQWEADETVRSDFDRLFSLLTDAGVKERIAHRIVSGLIALEERYLPILERGPPSVLRRRTRRPMSAFYGRRGYEEPVAPPRYSRRTGSARDRYVSEGEPVYTDEDMRRARHEERTDHRIGDLEKSTTDVTRTLKDLRNDLPTIIRNSVRHEEPEGTVVIEEIPVDATGKPAHPDKAVTIKRIKRPKEERRESLKDTLSELKELGVIMTADKVKEIVEASKPEKPTGKAPEIEAFEKKLEDQANRLEQMRAEREQERFDSLHVELDRSREEISALRGEIRSKPRGTYSDDEYRYLDTLTREAARRHPLQVMVDFGRELAFPGEGTPQRSAAEGGRGRILRELRRRNLTVPE